MADDPYSVLGVARDATTDDIRKAYRALAKKLHPDLNPGDKGAEARFKRLSQANEILGDAEKRRRFDAGEIDAVGQEKPQARPQPDAGYYRDYADSNAGQRYHSRAGYDDMEGMSDVFADLFGGGGGRARGDSFNLRGSDVRYRLEVDFLTAVRGGKQRVVLPDGGSLDVTVPAGVEDGQMLRLRGKGMAGIGSGGEGDALIEIGVAPHPLFERRGNDIHSELPVSLAEAVLGGKVPAPTIDGSVNVSVPKGSSSGRTLRLRGKGVHPAGGTAAGDHYVKIRIVLPDIIDADLEKAVREWSAAHPYDARMRKEPA